MVSMSYCMYENTVAELGQVFEALEDWDPNEKNGYEKRARKQLAYLVSGMQEWAEQVLDEEETE